MPIIVDPADTPHNLITNCDECHNGVADRVADATLDNAKCLVCHGTGGSLNQADDFAGLTTGDAGRPTFGNWTGVNGDDGTNGWMAWTGSTGSAGTGPSAGNPGNYVVLESSPISSGGGSGVVSVLNTWQHVANSASSSASGSFTTSTGSDANRLVVVAVMAEVSTSTSNTFTVTYGGQTVTGFHTDTNNAQFSAWFGYMKEAQIDAKSGSTVSVTVNGGNVVGVHVKAIALDDVDQGGDPISDSGSTYSTARAVTLSPALTVVDGDRVVVAGAQNDTAISDTGEAGYSAYAENENVNGFSSMTKYRTSTAAGSAAPACQNTGGATDGIILAAGIKAAAVGGGDEDPVNGVDVTAGSEQYLESNVIDASTYALDFTFDWNMNVGDNTDASLHLDAWNGTSWDLDITGGAIKTGDNGDVWTTVGPVDLSTYTNADFQLRFRYIVGNGTIHQNDVAVDNLVIIGTSGGSATLVETHHTPADRNCTDYQACCKRSDSNIQRS
jgi:hypothetical protein